MLSCQRLSLQLKSKRPLVSVSGLNPYASLLLPLLSWKVTSPEWLDKKDWSAS